MINIQISQEEMKRPEVYQTAITLLSHLSGSPEPVQIIEAKPQKKKHKDQQVGTPNIDEEVKARYGNIVTKAKSLYFLSIIKQHGTIDSRQIAEEMTAHYPQMTRKSIGGITGAVSRWFQKDNESLPYSSRNDTSQPGLHIFTWVNGTSKTAKGDTSTPSEEVENTDESDFTIDPNELDELISMMPPRFRGFLGKLVTQGSISKEEVGAAWLAFSKAVMELGTTYFENEGNRIVTNYK